MVVSPMTSTSGDLKAKKIAMASSETICSQNDCFHDKNYGYPDLEQQKLDGEDWLTNTRVSVNDDLPRFCNHLCAFFLSCEVDKTMTWLYFNLGFVIDESDSELRWQSRRLTVKILKATKKIVPCSLMLVVRILGPFFR